LSELNHCKLYTRRRLGHAYKQDMHEVDLMAGIKKIIDIMNKEMYIPFDRV
jgi:hypothetical protein